ncbi:MAG: DUF4071 domain-containing protein [Magnetococcus sp. MYC-9]
MKPFCFVLMPFGSKSDDGGRMIHFDSIYEKIIAPAIENAGMEPMRADREMTGGFIHKAMFERLLLCDYAVADLTTANANVFYELGIRHGIRPHSTVLIFSQGSRLPFDIAPLRGVPYHLDALGGLLQPEEDRNTLTRRLDAGRQAEVDSPLYQLVSEWPQPEIARLKTDRFRELVSYSSVIKAELTQARHMQSRDALAGIEARICLEDADPAIVIDLYLSYRAVKAWQEMVGLVQRMPRLVRETVLVQEQFGMALNRLGRHQEAERVLQQVIERHGASSETCGILGRVYKDLWEYSHNQKDRVRAQGYLRKAIDAYLDGFHSDWRDAYPGINAVTLMEMCDPPDPRQKELLPVVRFAVKRRLNGKRPDYWDHATLLELAFLAHDREEAEHALAAALTTMVEPWQLETTARNVRLIRENRAARHEPMGQWSQQIEDALACSGI